MLALLVLAAGIFFLLPSFLPVRFAERDLKRALDLERQESIRRPDAHAILAEAKKTKEAIAEIKVYAGDGQDVLPVLDRFFPVGEGITILSFVVRGGGEVLIEGHAVTREQLLIFEETLRLSDQFLEVSFPLEDIVRESDIRFSMKAKLTSAYRF